MGWWKRWREGRSAARGRAHPDKTLPPESQESPQQEIERHLSVSQILGEIERSRLEFAKLEWEHKIAELNATAEERKEEREYRRAEKEKARKLRADAAAKMKELRATNPAYSRKKQTTQVPIDCLDCEAILRTGDIHNRTSARDMVRHAREGHDRLFRAPDGNAN